MKKNNVIETVNQKIAQLMEVRDADLLQIKNKIAEGEAKEAQAEKAMNAAAAEMDAEKYTKAEHALRVARVSIQMYNTRLEQITNKELITESESDAIIDSILEYEGELAAEFKAAIVAPLKTLKTLAAEYAAEVEKAERTLSIWQLRAKIPTACTI